MLNSWRLGFGVPMFYCTNIDYLFRRCTVVKVCNQCLPCRDSCLHAVVEAEANLAPVSEVLVVTEERPVVTNHFSLLKRLLL